MREELLKKFLRYVRVDTKSDPGSKTMPSSPGQTTLAEMLRDELNQSNASMEIDIIQLKDGSFMVRVPATTGKEDVPRVCFAAHMDTSPDAPGGAEPFVCSQYKGGDLALPHGDKISADDLKKYVGCDIVHASGTTTLGADDKAGIAIMMDIIQSSDQWPHGQMYFWFCVDEEIGRLDHTVVPADILQSWQMLITLDGDNPEEIAIGCFSGWETIVTFKGKSFHPGTDGHKICSALSAATELAQMLKAGKYRQPWTSSGMESLINVTDLNGTHSEATVKIYPRSFKTDELPLMHEYIVGLAETAAKMYGTDVEFTGQGIMYVNNCETTKSNERLWKILWAACEGTGLEAKEVFVRGGTDGAMLSRHIKIPAPNIGVGMHNFHGTQEFLVVEQMVSAAKFMKNFIKFLASTT